MRELHTHIHYTHMHAYLIVFWPFHMHTLLKAKNYIYSSPPTFTQYGLSLSVWSQLYFHRIHLFVSFETIHIWICMWVVFYINVCKAEQRGSGRVRIWKWTILVFYVKWMHERNVIYFFTRPSVRFVPTLSSSLHLSFFQMRFRILFRGWIRWKSLAHSTIQKYFVHTL